MTRTCIILLLAILGCETPASHLNNAPRYSAAHSGSVAWAKWNTESFSRAKAEGRLVIVTVVTEWCHWCHVMDEATWGDAQMQVLLDERFVVIREDADGRPDLAERYADWGWPAIALLTADGDAVTEWRGYQEARRFEKELRAYVSDLAAGKALARKAPVVDTTPQPLQAARDFTRARLDSFYDKAQGGWGRPQKYPLWAPISAGLFAGTVGQDKARLDEVKRTLDGELSLIDPVDGGMFQYSLKGVWTAPHYEKLAVINGTAMENLADAWALTGDARYLKGAKDIARYVTTTLRRDDGAFFANQDADVGTRGETARVLGIDYYALSSREARAQKGEPFVDRHVYASHNGRLIAGLARLGMLSGDDTLVEAARTAASTIVTKDIAAGMGFTHDIAERHDPIRYLDDQVAMGHALLTLSEATGDVHYRQLAAGAARYIVDHFEDKEGGGFYAHKGVDVDDFMARRKPLKLNGEAARFVLKVGRLEKNQAFIAAAERALAAFAVFDLIKEEYRHVGELLLAFDEQLHEPVRFAIVVKDGVLNAQAMKLLRASNAVYAAHRLVDVQEPGTYPESDEPTLYICGSTYCSPPITDPAQVAAKAARFLPR